MPPTGAGAAFSRRSRNTNHSPVIIVPAGYISPLPLPAALIRILTAGLSGPSAESQCTGSSRRRQLWQGRDRCAMLYIMIVLCQYYLLDSHPAFLWRWCARLEPLQPALTAFIPNRVSARGRWLISRVGFLFSGPSSCKEAGGALVSRKGLVIDSYRLLELLLLLLLDLMPQRGVCVCVCVCVFVCVCVCVCARVRVSNHRTSLNTSRSIA